MFHEGGGQLKDELNLLLDDGIVVLDVRVVILGVLVNELHKHIG